MPGYQHGIVHVINAFIIIIIIINGRHMTSGDEMLLIFTDVTMQGAEQGVTQAP